MSQFMAVALPRSASSVLSLSGPTKCEQRLCVVLRRCSTHIVVTCIPLLEIAKKLVSFITLTWTHSSEVCPTATANIWPCCARLRASTNSFTSVKRRVPKIPQSSYLTRSSYRSATEAGRHSSQSRAHLSCLILLITSGALQLRHYRQVVSPAMCDLPQDAPRPSWT